jgi:hypothetical protein
MALSALRGLVHRLMSDSSLREKLHRDPEGVFSAYELSPEEKAAVLSVNARYGFDASSGAVLAIRSQSWWA